MRAYTIEDIYNDNAEKVVAALDDMGLKGPIEGIYYLPLPEHLLEDDQREHLDECGPYMMALEVIDRRGETHDLKLELLVRARRRMRCSCVRYANAEQRAHMLDYLDNFLLELGIQV
ncbi:MAG: hypothetical protein AB7D51_07365 [Desulfovibrionaceae bacterium]